MMIGRIPRWFLTVGIVTATLGCDNVSWGGIRVAVEAPPPGTGASSTDSAGAEAGGVGGEELAIPQVGPLLYAAVRSGDSATVTPVGELVEGELRELPGGEVGEAVGREIIANRLQPGAELTLFQAGVRIGSLVVTNPGGLSDVYCTPRPSASGKLELIPGATDAQRFLALEKPRGRQWPFAPYRPETLRPGDRSASLDLGAAALTESGARWPSSLSGIRQDLQALRLPGREEALLTATFLFQDQLAVAPSPEDAYALMVIGEPEDGRHALAYTWYRPVQARGKGAPLPFGHFDWDRDGTDELLLEVFGADARWWAALGQAADGSWHLEYENGCGEPPAAIEPG